MDFFSFLIYWIAAFAAMTTERPEEGYCYFFFHSTLTVITQTAYAVESSKPLLP